MPKNKPKYKKAGAKSGTGAPAAEKRKQPKGAAKGKAAAPGKGGSTRSRVAGAAPTKTVPTRAAAAKAAPAKRLRFVSPAARESLGKLGDSAGRSWQRLKILLRLSGSGDTAKTAGQEAAATAGTRSLKRAPGVQKQPVSAGVTGARAAGAGKFGKYFKGLVQSPWLQNLYRQVITFDGLMAILLAIMLFYPPFFRGLFFQNELLPTHMLTAAVFALFAFYKLTRGELAFFERPLDYAVFVLLALYITSSIDAWNTRDAIAAALKMANYAAVYWLLAYSVRSLSAVRGYLGVLLASGAGVSLLGLGAAIGTFTYKDAFVNGRIFGSLQYPNTTASFLTAINLFGLYLWDESRSKALGALLAAANYLLFLTILGTQSRGALLIYPIGLIILMIGLKSRWRILGKFAVQLIASVAVYNGMMIHTDGQTQLLGWLWVLGGAVLAALIHIGWQYLEQQRQQGTRRTGRRVKPWVTPAVAALIVIILAGGGYTAWRYNSSFAAFTTKLASNDLVSRLRTISLSNLSFTDRVTWSSDGLRIMTASPVNALLGTGGGGWNSSYHKFQSYPYFSTEVHNHFIQVGVETGFPGLITFLLIWVFFIATAWKLYRHVRPGGKADPGAGGPGAALPATTWVILSSAVALGAHSALDFNLSLGAVALLLWGLFGLMRGLDRLYGPETAARAAVAAAEAAAARDRRSRRYKKNEPAAWKMPSSIQGLIVGALAAVVFFWSFNLLIGVQYAQAAGTAAQGNNADAAVSNMEQAVRHDTWNTDFRSTLAQYYLYQAQVLEIQSYQDPANAGNTQSDQAALLTKARDMIEAAIKQDRGDSNLYMLYAQVLFRTGSIAEGLNQLEQVRTSMPLASQSYEALANGYFVAGRFYLEQAAQAPEGTADQDVQKARQQGQEALLQALGVPQRVQDQLAGVPANVLKLWEAEALDYPMLEVAPQVYQNAGMAGVLLGRYQEADTYLDAALKDDSLKATTQLWQGISLQQQGKDADGQKLIDEALVADESLAQELDGIKPLLPE
jgi:hypothetical protein